MSEFSSEPSKANTERTEMICPIVLRNHDGETHILAFSTGEETRHVMVAPLDASALPREAALVSLTAMSGLTPSSQLVDLGKSKGIDKGESWHFFGCPISSAPDEWQHPAPDTEDVTFSFFWQPIDTFIDEDWHPAFIRAIRYVQGKLERMDMVNRDRLLPQSQTNLSDAILKMAKERGVEKSFCPSEIARSLAGSDEKQWRALMKPIRKEAIRLANQGQVTITRKGKTVDPNNFKGLYRITQH